MLQNLVGSLVTKTSTCGNEATQGKIYPLFKYWEDVGQLKICCEDVTYSISQLLKSPLITQSVGGCKRKENKIKYDVVLRQQTKWNEKLCE